MFIILQKVYVFIIFSYVLLDFRRRQNLRDIIMYNCEEIVWVQNILFFTLAVNSASPQ
jgi:hypothetical protein